MRRPRATHETVAHVLLTVVFTLMVGFAYWTASLPNIWENGSVVAVAMFAQTVVFGFMGWYPWTDEGREHV